MCGSTCLYFRVLYKCIHQDCIGKECDIYVRISYDEESCRLVGEIVNVCADERILNAEGKIDITKFSPITYDPVYHTYRKLGEVVGQAFSEGLKLK